MKISIITVVLNNKPYIEDCINSVLGQSYKNIDYIIVDGGSTDGTVDVIRKYERHLSHWLSEKDRGIYEAMNKGIKLATGEVVGILNSMIIMRTGIYLCRCRKFHKQVASVFAVSFM